MDVSTVMRLSLVFSILLVVSIVAGADDKLDDGLDDLNQTYPVFVRMDDQLFRRGGDYESFCEKNAAADRRELTKHVLINYGRGFFVREKRFRLNQDGKLYDIPVSSNQERYSEKLSTNPEHEAERDRMQKILDEFMKIQPSNDKFSGTNPGSKKLSKKEKKKGGKKKGKKE